MLKRGTKIQKYISNLKKKQIKKNSLKNHTILQHIIQIERQEQQAPKIQTNQPTLNVQIQVQQQQQQQKPCWYDEDECNQANQEIQLSQRNKFRKLINVGMSSKTNVQQYEKKIGKFYQARYKINNWAADSQNIQEKDVNDYLNQDIYFSDKRPANKTIKFYAKSSEKHESVITGLDWHKSIMFTCGLDHKLKVFHFQPEQTNPQLKLRQQKDIYMQDLPLSNCYYRQNGLLMGTLRKNIVLVDTQKWKPTFITSTFLKDHKTYQNLRSSQVNGQSAIFSDNKLSILDKNNVYVGSLLANQNIQDVCFGVSNLNSVYAVTNDSIYQWDTRKLQIIKTAKKYLSFTSITATADSLNIGSKLGTVYIYSHDFSNPLQNNNLLTHVTKVASNKAGNLTIALSKWKANAIRVIDSLTGKSIGDWPAAKTKVGIPMQAGFGDQDYFSVGNSHGYVSVYGFNNQML